MLVWLDDLRLNAEVSGPDTAPPLVLVHGLGTDLTVWDAILPALAAHRTLRLDLRGHGLSDTPPPPYAMGALVRDAERLMQHFALKDAVILGAGEGGLVAQGLAVKRLDPVRAMVLTGSATRFGNPDLWDRRIAGLRDHGPDIDAECATLLGPRWHDLPAAAATRRMLARTRPEGWQGLAAAVANTDFYQTTATLTLPTLVLAGGDDRKTPPDMQRETAALVTGADFQVLPGAGHLAMLTHPQPFAVRLGAFLTRIGHV
ncbi:MAG: 3-oxoadipate enol-lactonase [Rhodobacter sp.]|nr:3-oxoadipate enol-lactonase [Rhodobacter sp.]